MESHDRRVAPSLETVYASVTRLRPEDKLRLWRLLEAEIDLAEEAVLERDLDAQSEIRETRAAYDAGEVHALSDVYGAGKPTLRVTAELTAEKEGGYSVYCPELDIYTQGESEPDCLENLREAAELHLEELGDLSQVRQVIRRQLEIATSS